MRDIYIIFGFVTAMLFMLGMMVRRRRQCLVKGNAYMRARQQAQSGQAQQATVTKLMLSKEPQMYTGQITGRMSSWMLHDIHYVDAAGAGVVTTPVPAHAMAGVAPGQVILLKSIPDAVGGLMVDFDAMGFSLDERWRA